LGKQYLYFLLPEDLVAHPILADYIWIGGGTLGLILVIVIVVLLLRK
jgi:hypothetical protein